MSENWQTRFRSSLEEFAKRRWDDSEFYSRSFDSTHEGKDSDESEDVFYIAWRALAHSYVEKSLRHLEALMQVCESPIEEMMLFALCVVCHQYADNVRYEVSGHHFGDLEEGIDSFTIEPQARVGDYRVDFLVTYGGYVKEAARASEAATNASEFVWRSSKLIVECDGHEFHERTKQQASKDKARDRELQKLGFIVFRYSGSDIWKDAIAQAEDAAKALQAKVDSPG